MFLTVAQHTGRAPFQTTNPSFGLTSGSGPSASSSPGPGSSTRTSTGNDVLYLLALVDYAVLAKRVSVAEGHGLASGRGTAPGHGLGLRDKGPGLGQGPGGSSAQALPVGARAGHAQGPVLGETAPGHGLDNRRGLGQGLRRAMSLRTTPVTAAPTLTGTPLLSSTHLIVIDIPFFLAFIQVLKKHLNN